LSACEGTHARELVEAKCAKEKDEWGTCTAGASVAETYASYKLYARANISRGTPAKALAEFEETFIKAGLAKQVAAEWAQKAVTLFQKRSTRNVAVIGILVGTSSVAISLFSTDDPPQSAKTGPIDNSTHADGTVQQPLIPFDQGVLTGKAATDALAASVEGRPFVHEDLMRR
jgi:hypothetical protein